MKRRTFIVLLSGFLAVFTLPRKRELMAAARKTQDADSRALARALAGLFSKPANARTVGVCSLREYPEISDRRRLLANLGLDVAGSGIHDVRSLIKHLREGQTRDFIAGDTVMVNRWLLPATEIMPLYATAPGAAVKSAMHCRWMTAIEASWPYRSLTVCDRRPIVSR